MERNSTLSVMMEIIAKRTLSEVKNDAMSYKDFTDFCEMLGVEENDYYEAVVQWIESDYDIEVISNMHLEYYENSLVLKYEHILDYLVNNLSCSEVIKICRLDKSLDLVRREKKTRGIR